MKSCQAHGRKAGGRQHGSYGQNTCFVFQKYKSFGHKSACLLQTSATKTHAGHKCRPRHKRQPQKRTSATNVGHSKRVSATKVGHKNTRRPQTAITKAPVVHKRWPQRARQPQTLATKAPSSREELAKLRPSAREDMSQSVRRPQTSATKTTICRENLSKSRLSSERRSNEASLTKEHISDLSAHHRSTATKAHRRGFCFFSHPPRQGYTNSPRFKVLIHNKGLSLPQDTNEKGFFFSPGYRRQEGYLSPSLRVHSGTQTARGLSFTQEAMRGLSFPQGYFPPYSFLLDEGFLGFVVVGSGRQPAEVKQHCSFTPIATVEG